MYNSSQSKPDQQLMTHRFDPLLLTWICASVQLERRQSTFIAVWWEAGERTCLFPFVVIYLTSSCQHRSEEKSDCRYYETKDSNELPFPGQE